jgi:hypothetical protein
MLKLEYDEDKHVIRVGEAQFSPFDIEISKKAWLHAIFAANKGVGLSANPYCKEQNKAIGDFLGCSHKVLWQHFDKLRKAKFVAPVYPVIKKLTTNYCCRGRFDPHLVYDVNKHKKILLEVYDDGLYNLLPIVRVTGKTPKELKVELGGVWKQLTKNSLRRNNLIATHYKKGCQSGLSPKEVLTTSASSTLLDNYAGFPEVILEYMKINFKGRWADKNLWRELHFVVDAYRMAGQLGEKINHKWSPRRMKEEHDKFAIRINQRKYSPEPFECLKDFQIREFEHEGYKATLLDNPFSVYTEGSSMGHCVGGYSPDVAQGKYLVYSVTKDGERSSTIGLTRDGNTAKFQQHYGRFNAIVTDEAEKAIAQLLIEAINKGEAK